MTERGYKVVGVSKGELCSWMAHAGKVRYGQFWAKPNDGCGPLCVFRNIPDITVTLGEEIWSCEYEPSKYGAVWRPGSTRELHELLDGTVLADRVRLIEMVPRSEYPGYPGDDHAPGEARCQAGGANG
jgi:hypothetical protein